MANVVLSKEFQSGLAVDGSIKARAFDLLHKLVVGTDSSDLNLKQPKGALDPPSGWPG